MRTNAQKTTFVLLVAGILVLVNILSIKTFARGDLTRDKMFTLSAASRDTMKSLEDPVTVTAYFTENLPAPYSGNARYVRDLLQEYRAASKGKLSFEFIDPTAQESEADKEKKKEVKRDIFGRTFREPTQMEQELADTGVEPVEIRVVEEDQSQTKRAYMGLVIKHKEKKEVIPVVQDTDTLEYDLTSLLRKMTRPKMPVIGLLMPEGEQPQDNKFRRLHTVLSQTYEPKAITTKDLAAATDLDAIFVLGPKTPLDEAAQKALDQFLMKGKSIAFLLDSVKVNPQTFEPTNAEHGLTPMLQTYGLKLNEGIVADVESMQISFQERRGFMVVDVPTPYPFVPIIPNLEDESPISKGLSRLGFPFSNAVDIEPREGVTTQVLAKSSDKSWLEKKPYNVDPRRDWRNETITPGGPYNLLVQATGKFKSHFVKGAENQSAAPTEGLSESTGEARIIVAGTSSIASDPFMAPPNQVLMHNIADWLLLDPSMLAMRARGMEMAPLKPELPDAVRNGVKWGNVVGIPLILVAFGLVRWRVRESRRATVTA